MPWPQHFICCSPCIFPFMPLPPVPMPIMPPSSMPMPILSDTDGLSATGGVEGFTDESCARTAEPTCDARYRHECGNGHFEAASHELWLFHFHGRYSFDFQF